MGYSANIQHEQNTSMQHNPSWQNAWLVNMGRRRRGYQNYMELLFNCLTYSDRTNRTLSSPYHSPHNICCTQETVHSLIKPCLVMKQFFHTPWKFKTNAASVWCTLMDGSHLTLSNTMNNNKHKVLLDKLQNIMHLKEDPDLPSTRKCTPIFGLHFPWSQHIFCQIQVWSPSSTTPTPMNFHYSYNVKDLFTKIRPAWKN
jgi:hypothetical protein